MFKRQECERDSRPMRGLNQSPNVAPKTWKSWFNVIFGMATLLRIPWDRKLFKLFVLHEEFLRFEGAVFQFASWVFQISQLLMQLMTAFRLTRAYFKNFSNPHTSENATWRDFEVLIFNGGRQKSGRFWNRKSHGNAIPLLEILFMMVYERLQISKNMQCRHALPEFDGWQWKLVIYIVRIDLWLFMFLNLFPDLLT
jgi:hypothetical protein